MLHGRVARSFPAGIIAGVFAAYFLFIQGWSVWPLATAILPWVIMLLAIIRRSPLAVAVVLSLCWSAFAFHHQLEDRLPAELNGRTLTVQGRVADLPQQYPEYTRFRFHPLNLPSDPKLPGTILAYWYRDPPAIAPGEIWQLQLQLRPPWGRVNFQGSDRERWLFAEGIGALATVRGGELQGMDGSISSQLNALRNKVRSLIVQAVPGERTQGVVLALAIADLSKLSVQQNRTFSRTGTAHLLAISGQQVSLAAMFGFLLARLLLLAVPPAWMRGLAYPAAMFAGLFLATVYAALAGFGTSTVRALVMLMVGILMLATRRTTHLWQAWLTAMAAVLLLDPPALLGAGFWMSFAAVAVLLLLFSNRAANAESWWRSMLRAQVGITLFMLPLGAWWFQSVSLSGLAANLLAIPWVSFITVPLILLGLLLVPLSTTLALLAFYLAGASSEYLLLALEWLAALPASAVALAQPSVWAVAVASLGGLLLLLPRGLPHRWLGLLLLAPLLAPFPRPSVGSLRLDVLDVGQGTAVLVGSSEHLLVYDSGPGDGQEFNLVDQVMVPAILQSGYRSPDRIIISHGDMDHAGGLNRLMQLFPHALVHANVSVANLSVTGGELAKCRQGLEWAWDGISFQVLHPSPYLPYIRNDSSCVVSIGFGKSSILLPGDISSAIEDRLVRQGIGRHQVLLVPHHGSKSSSSAGFLEHVQPLVAVATTGLGNRFGFPRPETRQRYLEHGIPLWSTDACGAIRVELAADGSLRSYSARKVQPAPWRWPAADFCP